MGSVAVQIALAQGARVIGADSPDDHDYLRKLGAEPVARGAGLADQVLSLSPDGADAVFDAAGHGALFPLRKATEALRAFATGDIPGKVVLEIG